MAEVDLERTAAEDFLAAETGNTGGEDAFLFRTFEGGGPSLATFALLLVEPLVLDLDLV